MTLFVDSDGVVADFDHLANQVLGMNAREFEKKYGPDLMWKKIGEYPRFYLNLPMMQDAWFLWENIKKYNPVFLTGSPSQLGEKARVDKFLWFEKMFGPHQRVVVVQSKLKSLYCKKGDIIIDDWPKHQQKWVDAGGIWILHKDAKTTVEELKKYDLG